MDQATHPGRYEVTVEELLLAFSWASSDLTLTSRQRNDVAMAVYAAWRAVEEHGQWPDAPARPHRPKLRLVESQDATPTDRELLEELQGSVRTLMANMAPEPKSDSVSDLPLRPRKTDREIIDLYVLAMRRRNLAPTTIEVRDRFFRQFLRAMGCGFAKVTREKIERWLDSGRKGPMLGARARRWRLSTLDVFYRWAVDEGLLQDNPAAKIAKPKLPQAMPRPMRDADLVLALEKATPEMRCWLLLGAYEGLRCCEIAGLDREDVLEDVGQLRVTQGKGGKERMLPLHPDVLAALQALPMRPTGALFRRPRCLDRCPPYVVSQRISAYLVSIGLEHTGAHQLRHWFGVHTYRANADLLLVQKLLGHSSPGVTANYAAADPSHAAPTVAGLHVGP
jgi:integrase/recombinase XerC